MPTPIKTPHEKLIVAYCAKGGAKTREFDHPQLAKNFYMAQFRKSQKDGTCRPVLRKAETA